MIEPQQILCERTELPPLNCLHVSLMDGPRERVPGVASRASPLAVIRKPATRGRYCLDSARLGCFLASFACEQVQVQLDSGFRFLQQAHGTTRVAFVASPFVLFVRNAGLSATSAPGRLPTLVPKLSSLNLVFPPGKHRHVPLMYSH